MPLSQGISIATHGNPEPEINAFSNRYRSYDQRRIATDFRYNGVVSFPAASISKPHYMPEPTSALPSRIATLPRYFAAAIVVAVCYFSVAWLGLTFAIPPGNATVVWPASGIAVGALYFFGYRLWPAVWTGSCLVNLTTGVSFGVASSFATGNTIEAIVAVLLLRRFLPEDAFKGARRFRFLSHCYNVLRAGGYCRGSLDVTGRTNRRRRIRCQLDYLVAR